MRVMHTIQTVWIDLAMRCQQANILLLAQDMQRFWRKFRSNDGLVEQVVDLASGVRVHGPVTANNAAEGRDRIASVRFMISLHQPVITGQAARVGMLDDRKGRRTETLYRGERGIQVKQVIE